MGAHISLLGVLPGHRGRDIGGELVRRMLAALRDLYLVGLVRDPESVPFYVSPAVRPAGGMVVRRYTKRSGKNAGGAIY